MARTAVSVVEPGLSTAQAFVAGTTGTALDATNDHVITPPAGCPVEELVVIITNTAAASKDFTVVAGDSPPALEAGRGDLTVTTPAGDTTPQSALVVLESAQFVQSDGTVLVDVPSGATGRIVAVRVPRS